MICLLIDDDVPAVGQKSFFRTELFPLLTGENFNSSVLQIVWCIKLPSVLAFSTKKVEGWVPIVSVSIVYIQNIQPMESFSTDVSISPKPKLLSVNFLVHRSFRYRVLVFLGRSKVLGIFYVKWCQVTFEETIMEYTKNWFSNFSLSKSTADMKNVFFPCVN